MKKGHSKLSKNKPGGQGVGALKSGGAGTLLRTMIMVS